MTFKHNSSFSESEVMRSLERLAIERGEFDPTPEDKVKMAASKLPKKLAALEESDSIFGDILNLTAHLRSKGLVEEAQEIEQNLMLYKKAEKHLYNVHDETGEAFLNYVYKDGDKEIAPAKEDYGVVHTPQNAAKKIRDIVNKQPTGDLKEAADAILKGVNKTAQRLEFVEETESDEQLLQYFNQIKNHLEKARRALKIDTVMPTDGDNLYKFTEGRLLGALSNEGFDDYLNLYVRYSGANKSRLTDFYKRYKAIYGNKPESVAAIVDIIKNVSPENAQQLTNWARNAGNFDNYFWGSQPGTLKSITPTEGGLILEKNPKLAPDNSQSIWEVGMMGEGRSIYTKDLGQVQRVASQIHQIMQNLKANAFSEIKQANNKLSTILNSTVNAIDSVNFSDVSASLSRDNYKAVKSTLKENFSKIKSLLPKQSVNKEIANIMTAFGLEPNNFNKHIIEAIKVANKIYRTSSPKSLIISDPQVVVTRFEKAMNLYNQYAERVGQDHPKYEFAKENVVSAANLMEVAESVKGQSYQILYEQIKDSYPEIDTWEKFDKLSQEWLIGARQDTGLQAVSSKEYNLTKFALEIKRRHDLSKETTSPSHEGVARSKEARPTEEEQQKVSLMQRNINDFALALHQASEKFAQKSNLSPEEIRSKASVVADTGRNKFDGMWGQRTQNSLRIIAQILQSAELNVPELLSQNSFRDVNAEEVIEKADKNTSIISSALRELELSSYIKNPPKGQEAEFTYFDIIPKTLTSENFNQFDEGSTYIHQSDINSLTSFYDLLTGTNTVVSENVNSGRVQAGIITEKLIKAAQSVSNLPEGIVDPWAKEAPKSGMSKETFEAALRWLRQRAENVYAQSFAEKPTNPEKIKKAKEYRDAVSKLITEWNNKRGRFKENEAVTREKLTEEGVAREKTQEDATPSQKQNESAEGFEIRKRKVQQKAMERPPFDNFINVSEMMQNWGAGNVEAEWYEYNMQVPQLILSDFYRTAPQEFYQQVIPMEDINQEGDRTYYKKHPALYIQEFLNRLRRDMSIVYSVWSRWLASLGMEDERVRDLMMEQKKKYNQWTRAINTMHRRNTNWLRRGTKGLPRGAEVISSKESIQQELGY